jgi:hypothetical protein
MRELSLTSESRVTITHREEGTMEGDDDEGAQSKKVPYEKPVVHQVALRPEEAVLGACKTASSGGPVSMGTCSVPVACSTMGS